MMALMPYSLIKAVLSPSSNKPSAICSHAGPADRDNPPPYLQNNQQYSPERAAAQSQTLSLAPTAQPLDSLKKPLLLHDFIFPTFSQYSSTNNVLQWSYLISRQFHTGSFAWYLQLDSFCWVFIHIKAAILHRNNNTKICFMAHWLLVTHRPFCTL